MKASVFQESVDTDEVTDEVVTPMDQDSDQAPDVESETLKPVNDSPGPTRIVVKRQPISNKDPMGKKGYMFVINNYAIEVYDVKKSRKRFIKIIGTVKDAGAEFPVITPLEREDLITPLPEGSNITVEGWAYRVTHSRSRGRRFVKCLGVIEEEY